MTHVKNLKIQLVVAVFIISLGGESGQVVGKLALGITRYMYSLVHKENTLNQRRSLHFFVPVWFLKLKVYSHK